MAAATAVPATPAAGPAPGAKPPAAKTAEPAPEPAPVAAEFSKEAAASALSAAAAQAASTCGTPDGPKGTGKVAVTFVNSGRATQALVSGDLAGTAVGGCIARVFRAARVPSFSGDSVTVAKSVTIQ
jgi:hypothetical protein